jgi:hypothetical protein
MLTGMICSLVIVNECSSDMPKTSYGRWCYKGYVDALYLRHNDPRIGAHTKGVGDYICLHKVSKLIFSDLAIRFNKRRLHHHVRFTKSKEASTIYYRIMSHLARYALLINLLNIQV